MANRVVTGSHLVGEDETPITSVVSFKQAKELAKKHGTPLLVCDLKKVKQNYRQLKSLFPKTDMYYAVKANPLPEIIKTLVKEGSHFDVASMNEIKLCLEMGAKPEHLLYANPVKRADHIEYAYKNNVTRFTFDSPEELDKMAKYAPGSEVILRLVVCDVGSFCKFSTKFGARETSALALLKKAQAVGLHPIGLSFHVGSQCMRMDNFSTALEVCSRVLNEAEKEGIHLSVIDTGGGIPVRYVKDIYPLEDLAALLNHKIENLFPKDIKTIMEPGRPLVGSAMTLITKVIGTNRRGGRECAYLDDGCYNSLSEKIFGHCEYRIVSDNQAPMVKYVLFGPTCDSMDMISRESYLPRVQEGDIVLVLNTGSYTNAAATHFNGFEPAKIVFV